MCVFCTLWGYFLLDLHVFVAGPRVFVSSAKLFVSDLGFCFLDPCSCFVDLGSIGWGGTPLLYALTLGWMFLDLGAFFLTCTCFFDMAQGGGNLDIEPRCMQEVVDWGEVRISKQQKCKKWWRGRRGEVYVWSDMDVRNWEAHGGKRKLDIETRLARQVVERWGMKPRH